MNAQFLMGRYWFCVERRAAYAHADISASDCVVRGMAAQAGLAWHFSAATGK
jgi:hypothetical protein